MNYQRGNKVTILIFIFTIALVMVLGCAKDEEEETNKILTPADLLPQNEEISGWVSLGAYEEANDYDGLYNVIDGAAVTFIDNGFVSAVFQQYISSKGDVTATVHLRIYDQGSAENAKKTYDKVATGLGVPWNGAGTEARIDESGLATYTIEFWQRNFFVQVVIEEKSDFALNVAKLFASHVSSKIK